MDKLTVRAFMTESPLTIGIDQPLRTAHDLMRRHHIRHLPVLRAGELVGMVSDRDLSLLELMPGVDACVLTVPTEHPSVSATSASGRSTR